MNKLKISTKIFGSIIVIILLLISSAYLYINNIIHNNILSEVLTRWDTIKSSFEQVKISDIEKLSTALDVVVQDKAIKELYLKKDRNGLYEHIAPIFDNLKKNRNITHWYFILPDGHVFLRAHQKDVYGDEVSRPSFKTAQKSNKTESGLELGKTAFALRVVTPYYLNDQLIGYIELGEEIDHFLDILRGNSKDEFRFIAKKEFINKPDWDSSRRLAGLRNNWDDMPTYLVLGEHVISGALSVYITENNIEEELEEGTEREPNIFFSGDKYHSIETLDILDDTGKRIAMLFCALDITEQELVFMRSEKYLFLMLLLGLILSLSVGFYISRSISKPIVNLTDITQKISEGNHVFFPVDDFGSSDEVGELASSFNRMIKIVKEREEGLEDKIKERTKKISETLAEVDKMNKLMIGREVKMIGLKKDMGENLEIFKSIFDSIPLCVKWFDRDNKLISVNKGAIKEHHLESVKPEDIKNWDYISCIDERDREMVKQNMMKAQKGESSSFDMRHVPGTATGLWCHSNIVPIKDHTGDVGIVLFISKDITDTKKEMER